MGRYGHISQKIRNIDLGSRKENRDMNGQTDEGKNVGTASKLTI
jgi:hypothetical protein